MSRRASAVVLLVCAATTARARAVSPDAGTPPSRELLPKEVIRGVIKAHWPEVRACYEKEARTNPNLWGRIAVTFTISGSGEVSSAEVSESTMNNSKLGDCMVGHVKGWIFPKPADGGSVHVTYPWVFKSIDAK